VKRTLFTASLLAVALSGNVAGAQSPAIGQLPPVGDLYGYSPIVPTIDPFPSRSTGYAPSMFMPRVGGKRLYYPPVRARDPVIIVERCAAAPAGAAALAGPVLLPAPARAWYRFGREIPLTRLASATP
jgi:hypothetical protein